jgi:hypothetical protein
MPLALALLAQIDQRNFGVADQRLGFLSAVGPAEA